MDRLFWLGPKVVRKVLWSEATAFRYHRDQQPLRRIGPRQDELDRLLAQRGEAQPRCLNLPAVCCK